MPMESPDARGPSNNRDHKVRRSHTGCQKCRQTKVKCDEERPHCGRCVRLRHECDYRPRPRKKYTRKSHIRAPESASQEDSLADGVDSSLSLLSLNTSGGANSGLPLQNVLDNGSVALGSLNEAFQSSGPQALDLSSVSMESASILDPLDHAAIDYFRFIMPASVDGKTPKYSGPAAIWALAENDTMVMHGVCALSGRRVSEQVHLPADEAYARKCLAVEHCTEALRMLSLALEGHSPTQDLNCILGTLWLMLSYEQGFGDGTVDGFSAHLHGAAAMYNERIGNIREALSPFTATDRTASHSNKGLPSPLTCQLMVWIGLVDGGAAINGLGGAFCRLLGQCQQNVKPVVATAQLEIFRALQRRANMANIELWGSSYPQDELVDDLQNNQLMGLQAEVGQLRYLLSYLADRQSPDISSASESETDSRVSYETELYNVIHDIALQHSGIFQVVTSLHTHKMASASQRRFTTSARHICAFFHAVRLCFLRLVRGSQPLDEEQRASLREIMTLASLAYHDHGDDGMVQFAWSLFVAALELDDIIHRTWILERTEALTRRGENFRRAHNTLRAALSEQGLSDRRLEYASLVRRGDIDKFVLT